ncbi:hypothetical protein SUGI_0353730 [Cryptomeria japonica]|nr:hypothetical protein SUGI_0353730 [Cryptomeria japonica]
MVGAIIMGRGVLNALGLEQGGLSDGGELSPAILMVQEVLSALGLESLIKYATPRWMGQGTLSTPSLVSLIKYTTLGWMDGRSTCALAIERQFSLILQFARYS